MILTNARVVTFDHGNRVLDSGSVEVRADGMIAIGDTPGTGYQVREDLVRKFTVREETFRAGK